MSVSTFQLKILIVAVLVVIVGCLGMVLKDRQAPPSDAHQRALIVNQIFGLWPPLDGGLNSDRNIGGNRSSPPSTISLRTH
jgi:hypothetical protein